MPFSYKEDWPQARKRLEAFWAADAVDRAALGVSAPRATPLPGAAKPETPADPWTGRTDVGYLLAAAEHRYRTTRYLAESLPNVFPNLGPGWLATYFGSQYHYDDRTVWFGPTDYHYERTLARPDACPPHEFVMDIQKRLTEGLRGKAAIGHNDMGGGSDVLASLRTTEGLLNDLAEAADPAPIQRAIMEIAGEWMRAYDEFYDVSAEANEGSIQWLGVWAPGRMYNIQSDFSCMISPRMYDLYILPEVEALCRRMDYALYHLDGPQALQHLERLLSIPRLHGIQWTQGAANEPITRWIPLCRRIQAAGKCLWIYGGIEHAETMLRALKTEGLFYACSGIETEEQGEWLIRKAQQWAAGPRSE